MTFKGRQEKVNKKNKDYKKKPDLSFALKSKYLIIAAMEKVTKLKYCIYYINIYLNLKFLYHHNFFLTWLVFTWQHSNLVNVM